VPWQGRCYLQSDVVCGSKPLWRISEVLKSELQKHIESQVPALAGQPFENLRALLVFVSQVEEKRPFRALDSIHKYNCQSQFTISSR